MKASIFILRFFVEITGFNDNDNMMLVVELVVVFMLDFAKNKRAECRTVCGLVLTQKSV